MNENREFPAELVEERAQELYEAVWGAGEWDRFAGGELKGRYRAAARLSLRREVDACEPLVRVMEDALEKFPAAVWADKHRSALDAHRARYAPVHDALAELAREAADRLESQDVIGTHAQLAEDRALAAKLREAAKARAVKP